MEVAKVGVGVDPETMDISEFSLDNRLHIYDSPGLGDTTERDQIHEKKIRELLRKKDSRGNAVIDLVLVIVDGSSRDMGTTFSLLENVIIPELGEECNERLLVAINQADVAMKGKHWDAENNCPDPVLNDYLQARAISIQKRIMQNTGIRVDPIYYSAGYKEEGMEQMPPYNLSKLLVYILRAIPPVKRLVIAENLNQDNLNFEHSDQAEDYHGEIVKSLIECVVAGAGAGGQIGTKIGTAIAGSVGAVVGRTIGTVIGAIGGLLGGLFG